MINGWIYTGLNAGMGLSIAVISMIGVPLALVWGILAWRLGKTHESKSN